MSGTTNPTALPEWKAFEAHYQSGKDLQLRALFAGDPGRGERFCG
jgi:glucose-6-phosphate isomerase